MDIAKVVEEVIKHLPNRHNQKTHAGSVDLGLEKIRRFHEKNRTFRQMQNKYGDAVVLDAFRIYRQAKAPKEFTSFFRDAGNYGLQKHKAEDLYEEVGKYLGNYDYRTGEKN